MCARVRACAHVHLCNGEGEGRCTERGAARPQRRVLHLHLDYSVSLVNRMLLLKKNPKPIVGINPGASYGNSKRWYPQKFAQVATELSHKFDILIFGGLI